MDVFKSRKTNCLHCCCDFIWYISNAAFPITFPKVNFRIQHLIIGKVILIKLPKVFESGLGINISYFFLHWSITSGMMNRPLKIFKSFSKNLAFKSFSRCSITGIVNDLFVIFTWITWWLICSAYYLWTKSWVFL